MFAYTIKYWLQIQETHEAKNSDVTDHRHSIIYLVNYKIAIAKL